MVSQPGLSEVGRWPWGIASQIGVPRKPCPLGITPALLIDPVPDPSSLHSAVSSTLVPHEPTACTVHAPVSGSLPDSLTEAPQGCSRNTNPLAPKCQCASKSPREGSIGGLILVHLGWSIEPVFRNTGC